MTRYNLKAIKAFNNIIEVVKELGLQVTDDNRIDCLTPEKHDICDSHLSLILDPIDNTFHCLSCPDTRGDVIDLVRLKRKCSFLQALRYLIELAPAAQEDTGAPDPMRQVSSPGSPQLANDEFADIDRTFFNLLSPLTPEALMLLNAHGISTQTIDKMQVRYLGGRRKVEEALRNQFDFEKLSYSGLFNARGNLILSTHRIICPYFKDSEPVYFQGRRVDNSTRPEELCISRPVPYPYNIDVLKTHPSPVFVCEGLLNTLTLIEHGLPAIGIVGIGGFKDRWLPLFEGYQVKVVFRADISGHARAIELVQRFRSHKIVAEKVYLPEGCDVNRFFLAYRQFSA